MTDVNDLDRWTNTCAVIDVCEDAADQMVELLADIEGVVLTSTQTGGLRTITVTVEAARCSRIELEERIGQAVAASGADTVYARFHEELAWSTEM